MPEKFEVPPFASSRADAVEENQYTRANRYRDALDYAFNWHKNQNAAGPDQVIATAIRFERFLRTGTW